VAGVLSGSGLAVALALVWFAHIGMDRRCAWGCSTRTVLAAPTQDGSPDSDHPDPGGGAWTG
jgi:hypothetical protein